MVFAGRAKEKDFIPFQEEEVKALSVTSPDFENFPFLDDPLDDSTKVCTENPTRGNPQADSLTLLKRPDFSYVYPNYPSAFAHIATPQASPPGPRPSPEPYRPTPTPGPPPVIAPEPSTLVLFGLGFAGCASFMRKYRTKTKKGSSVGL